MSCIMPLKEREGVLFIDQSKVMQERESGSMKLYDQELKYPCQQSKESHKCGFMSHSKLCYVCLGSQTLLNRI